MVAVDESFVKLCCKWRYWYSDILIWFFLLSALVKRILDPPLVSLLNTMCLFFLFVYVLSSFCRFGFFTCIWNLVFFRLFFCCCVNLHWVWRERFFLLTYFFFFCCLVICIHEIGVTFRLSLFIYWFVWLDLNLKYMIFGNRCVVVKFKICYVSGFRVSSWVLWYNEDILLLKMTLVHSLFMDKN